MSRTYPPWLWIENCQYGAVRGGLLAWQTAGCCCFRRFGVGARARAGPGPNIRGGAGAGAGIRTDTWCDVQSTPG